MSESELATQQRMPTRHPVAEKIDEKLAKGANFEDPFSYTAKGKYLDKSYLIELRRPLTILNVELTDQDFKGNGDYKPTWEVEVSYCDEHGEQQSGRFNWAQGTQNRSISARDRALRTIQLGLEAGYTYSYYLTGNAGSGSEGSTFKNTPQPMPVSDINIAHSETGI